MADPKIKVTADTSQAKRELDSLERALGSLNGSVNLATKALAGITAAGAAMGFAIKKTMDSVDELAKTSRQLGMTSADLQAFRNSAALAGVGSDELTASLRRLQVNIGQALVKGTGPAKDALDRLGISMKELQGLSAQQQFQRIAEEIAKIPDPALRAATATELLGKQGPRLLEAANEFERMRREAELLGVALSAADTAAIERAGDAMSELTMIANGFLQKLTAEIAPVLIVIAERIKAAVIEMGGLDRIIRERVAPAFKIAVQAAAALIAYIAVGKIVAIGAAFFKLAGQVIAVARAMRTLGMAAAGAKAIATGGLSAIVTLTAGVAGAIAAASAAGRAMDSIFESAAEMAEEIANNVQDVDDNLNSVVDTQEIITDQARKALEAYEKSVQNIRGQIAYHNDILNLGREEADIRRNINQEAEKLAANGVEITESQRNTLRGLLEQQNSLKEQISLREEIVRLSDRATSKFEIPASRAFRQAKEDVKNALETIERASASSNQALIDDAHRLYAQQVDNYRQTVIQYGLSLTERGKLSLDHARQIAEIDTAILANKEINAGRETELQRMLNDQKLQLIEDYNRKVEDLERRRIERTLMMERSGFAAVLSSRDRAVLQRQGQEERQKKIVADRIEFEKKSETEKTQFALNNLQTVFGALAAQNKRAFEANKALAIASALVNTYQGATKALATYPWPFGLIAAAAAVASGMAQVAAIRSQQYSGRQLGGPVMGGKSYIVGENGPEVFTPTTTGSITRNRDAFGDGAVTVNFNISTVDAEGVDELLLERRGTITQIISDAMLERGQRL